MSVPTAETTVPNVGAHDGVTREPIWDRLAGGRVYGALIGVALVIATLSLLIPSTPSYDPWAWLVWGHEILHFSLHTPGGPTWKPLPVIFTTVFALFGHLQPDMWLIVARTGAIVAAFMAFKLAARLTWWLRDELVEDSASLERFGAMAPAILAGLVAMVGLVLSGDLISDGALGYSEGLLTAAVLMAVERHIDGHTHQAFALGFIAALDRPETWLFWGAYGLWLMWKDPSSRKLVIGLAVLTLLLWFVPQKWGGGSFTSGESRAQHPRHNSAAFASCPFCSELSDHAWPLVLLRIKIAALLVIGATGVVLVRTLRTRPGWKLVGARERALALLAVCGLFGFAWWILIAVETQAGFSGNDRYLVLGSAFVEVCGGAGFGWAAIALARLIRRYGATIGERLRPYLRSTAAAAISGIVFLIAPNWVGGNLIDLQSTHGALLYQAHLREDLAAFVKSHGGAKGVVACGPVMTEGFQVPMVAWYLGVRTIQVLDQPTLKPSADGLDPVGPGQWPATILQDRDHRHATLLPLAPTIIGWERQGAHYTVTQSKHHTFVFFQDCRK